MDDRGLIPAGASDPQSLALGFMHRWGGGIASLRSSITDYFTDTTIWENVGLNRLVGPAEALAFIDDFHARQGLDAIRFELRALLADDRWVMTERIDHLYRADGSLIHSTRIMGLFEIDDGKIVQQRDYFSPAPA